MSHLSQPINSTGLATTCFATTDHKDGLAVCALIDGHSGAHVDGTKQYAWNEDDCYGGMVLVSYLVIFAITVAALGILWGIGIMVTR